MDGRSVRGQQRELHRQLADGKRRPAREQRQLRHLPLYGERLYLQAAVARLPRLFRRAAKYVAPQLAEFPERRAIGLPRPVAARITSSERGAAGGGTLLL